MTTTTPSPHGVCPTCGQSLVDDAMLRRVTRARERTERTLRAEVQANLEIAVEERKEGEYADRMSRLRARIDQLQRQLDTRSSHDRGSDHEQDVLAALRSAFPTDRVERHGKRGDILHTILTGDQEIGRILYECKNAGVWQNAWLSKLKQDGRKRGTPYLVLVTRRLPAKARAFCVRDGIAVCEPEHVDAVATVVRQWVVSAHRAEAVATNMPDKARRLYEYLAGDEFRASFGDILDCANQLDAQDLAERSQHERNWGTRAKLSAQLRAAHLRIGGRLEAEAEVVAEADDHGVGGVVLEIPKRAA